MKTQRYLALFPERMYIYHRTDLQDQWVFCNIEDTQVRSTCCPLEEENLELRIEGDVGVGDVSPRAPTILSIFSIFNS